MNITRAVFFTCMIAFLVLITGLAAKAENINYKSSPGETRKTEAVREQARACYKAGKYDEAVTLFEKAAAADPGDASIWLDIGLVHMARKENESAEAAFRKALEVDTGNARAHLNLGVLALNREDFTTAEAEFQAAIKLRPGWPEALANLGGLYLKQGKKDEAMKEFQAALDADPKFLIALYNMAVLHKQNHDWKKAQETYGRILEIDPGAPMAHLEVAALYTNRLEQPAKAIYHYQRFLDLSPPGPMREKVRRSIQNIGGAETSTE